jgi:GH24 family phage-related lysozyme (muramidase)
MAGRIWNGDSPTVYICPAGYPTIGYGHVVKPQEREQFADGIPPEQAEALLRQDVQTAERAVLRLITVPLVILLFTFISAVIHFIGSVPAARISKYAS